MINFFDNNKKIYVNFISRKFNFFDPVAQLVEQWPFKPLVVSSSLTRITTDKKARKICGFFYLILKH